MYVYTAGATGLDAAMPPWVQEGGLDEWIKRLKNAKTRQRVVREMNTPTGIAIAAPQIIPAAASSAC